MLSFDEELLFEASTCHVFRLPPTNFLKSEEWEGNHIWTGIIRLIHHRPSQTHRIELRAEDGQIFGVCPLYDDAPNSPKSFQQSVDSTRCFVLRVENDGQHAFIGINFPGRSEAYSFGAAVLDRHKHSKPAEVLPIQDRSLSSGEKIQVQLAGKIKAPQQGSSVKPPVAISLAPLPAPSGISRRIRCDASGPPRPTNAPPAPQAHFQPSVDPFESPPPQAAPAQPVSSNIDDLFR